MLWANQLQGLRTEDVAKTVRSYQLLPITMSRLIRCQPEKKGCIRGDLAFVWWTCPRTPFGLLHLFEHEKPLAVLRSVPVSSGAGTLDELALKQDSGSNHRQGGTCGDLHRHPFIPIAVKKVFAVKGPNHFDPSPRGNLMGRLALGKGSNHNLTLAGLIGSVGQPLPIG